MKQPAINRPLMAALTALLVLALFPLGDDSDAYAKRKKKKKNAAGVITDSLYTDNQHGFSIMFLDDWKTNVKTKGKKLRVVASKKDYFIPVDFRNSQFHTTIPKVKVYVDTTSMELRAFIDSLKSRKFKSKQKQNIMLEFKALSGKFTRPRVTRIKSDSGIKGRRMKTTLRYKLEVQKAGGRDDNVVTDFIQADIALFKKENRIYIISCVCEAQFYQVNEPIFLQMIKSFAFTDIIDSAETPDTQLKTKN